MRSCVATVAQSHVSEKAEKLKISGGMSGIKGLQKHVSSRTPQWELDSTKSYGASVEWVRRTSLNTVSKMMGDHRTRCIEGRPEHAML